MCYYIQVQGCCDSVVSLVTKPQAGQSGAWTPAGVRDLSLLQSVHTSSGAHPISYSMCKGDSSPDSEADN